MTNEPSRPTPALDDAMQLFNSGKFAEVITLVSGTGDPALLLLAARSYADTCFATSFRECPHPPTCTVTLRM